jgi:uncharacterized protein YaiI (UPF0178 family)
LLRTAERLSIQAVFAANRPIPGISGAFAVMELCPAGEGAADKRLVELAGEGDIAVSRDIPLAEKLIEAGAAVIDDRGRRFTRENIRELVSLRNFMVGLAHNGLDSERAASYGKRELKQFADSLDRLLAEGRR